MRIVAAAMAAILFSVVTVAATPQERMPAVSLLHKMEEGSFTISRYCGPPEMVVVARFYSTFGHESDDGYKVVTLSRKEVRRPFFAVIYDDESKGDSEATGYADFNEDGLVDQKERLIVWDDHIRLFCEAHRRLTSKT